MTLVTRIIPSSNPGTGVSVIFGASSTSLATALNVASGQGTINSIVIHRANNGGTYIAKCKVTIDGSVLFDSVSLQTDPKTVVPIPLNIKFDSSLKVEGTGDPSAWCYYLINYTVN